MRGARCGVAVIHSLVFIHDSMGAGLTETFPFGRSARLFVFAALVLPVLAACSGGTVGESGVKRAAFTSKEFGVAVSPRVTKAKYPPRGGGRELPLKPYKVAGKTYQPVAGPGYVERGHASWYGQDFHGRRTANGEIFGAYYLTAASPVLPIPSYARVTNLENGRSVLVRVNDRGPYLKGRVVDLSYEAASALGYVNQGSARVEVRYVSPAPLEGDDTRMLTAAINRLTPLEQRQEQFGGPDIRVADNGGAPIPADRSSAFAYADDRPMNAAHEAADALASGQFGHQDWVTGGPETGADIAIPLGYFPHYERAAKVAEAFAALGAVDETSVDTDGSATILTLVRLKPGVTPADVAELARDLGLEGAIR